MSASAEPIETITLGRRQLYMLPTRHGLMFALVLLVLLLASINYANGLAYGLTFLLASLAVVSMLHTHRNLHKLTVAPGACHPVFAGEAAQFTVCLTNESGAPRYGLVIEQERGPARKGAPWRLRRRSAVARLDLAAGETACVALAVPAERRGWLAAPAFLVSTEFPLGLLYSWSRRIAFDQRGLVYPRPAPPTPLRAAAHEGAQPEPHARTGAGDDFAGLREYHAGDSPRHIHWKAVARGQGWYTKQFGGGAQTLLWLDWDTLEGFDTEARLAVLARWVLDTERACGRYGLKLPGTRIAPASGERHQHQCLAALALFGLRT